MRNIYLLPTDKETRLFTSDSELILAGYPATTFKTGKNIYITSDETPKLNDWCLDTIDKVVFKVTEEDILTMELDGLPFNFKKIILTTDQELITDGVQGVDDEFLEWFVKNPSCEEVEVVKGFPDGTNYGYNFLDYKIIIPEDSKEEATDLSTIENKIIECLNEAGDKLDANDFDILAESIVDYINEIGRSKKLVK